ncbi:MAG: hypothetical protein KIT73_01790 [Burkholderiales bacterium]|nr:hypothetical protein [Burkholderiales bacterium]
MGRLLLFASMLAVLALVHPAQARERPPKSLYAVTFGVVIGADQELAALRVVRVVDARSGSDETANVKVADAFVAAVRKQIVAGKVPPGTDADPTAERFSYFFYNPAAPTRIDIDPNPRHK